MNKSLIAAAAALVVAPIGALVPLAMFAGGNDTTQATALTAATVACVYGYPDADRVAATMADLTDNPVGAAQWDRYGAQAGMTRTVTTTDPDTGTETVTVEPIPYIDSTAAQRRRVLDTAVAHILWSTPPRAVTTPPMIWWYGDLPADDNDTAWWSTPVPGWDGDLSDYLAAFVEHYPTADVPGDDQATCTPPYIAGCAQPPSVDAALATIRHLESGDNYTEQHRSYASGGPDGSGWPSGAYQYLRSSWSNYGGYDEAWQAPPAIQDQRAAGDVTAILDTYQGDPAWIPVSWYIGPGGAAQVAAGTRDPNEVPNPAHNTVSVAEYQARWMEHYTTIALAVAGVEPVECATGGAAAVAWGETQIGSPYAAASPYRFGSPPWPGGTLTGDRGTSYTFPAGTIVYDCSGFVISAWRAVGVDLAGQYGIYGSQDLPHSALDDVDPAAVMPGDLAVYAPDSNGVGHVVMIHHVDTDGVVHTIEAVGGVGVTTKTINWARVTAIKRPPTG